MAEKSGRRFAEVRKKKALHAHVREHVEPGAEVFTDALKSYEGLSAEYVHQVVDHAVEYVKGHVHTNGLENFWSLLKRTLKGTYVSIEPFHLFRYLDEQSFRFNERKNEQGDGGRFKSVVKGCAGKRLTYREVTGKLERSRNSYIRLNSRMVKFTVAINNDNLEKLLSFIFKELGLHSGQAKKLLGDAHALVDCVEWPNFVR